MIYYHAHCSRLESVLTFNYQKLAAFFLTLFNRHFVPNFSTPSRICSTRFSRRALERLLNDWEAVKSMIMTGHKSTASAAAASLYEDRAFLTSQSGTALLDKFTHCLLVKCPVDMLDVLLGTLIRQLQLPNLEQRQEAKIVVKRYLKHKLIPLFSYNVENILTQ